MTDLQEVERPTPQWTPEQPMNKLIFDLIDQAGEKGISTMVRDSILNGLGPILIDT